MENDEEKKDEATNEESPVETVEKKARSSYPFFIILALIFVLRWSTVEPYVIPSGSMLPTLLVNDHIFVNKMVYGLRWPFSKKWIFQWGEVERGDVVVFRSLQDDGYFMIKRVVGLPGDEISYTEKGDLVVNGKKLERNEQLLPGKDGGQQGYYVVEPKDIGGEFENFRLQEEINGEARYRTMIRSDGFRWEEKPAKVPEGHVFVMGDYRDDSQDSRAWGALPYENLLGRAMFVWLSCYDTLDALPYICNPGQIRWRRILHWVR